MYKTTAIIENLIKVVVGLTACYVASKMDAPDTGSSDSNKNNESSDDKKKEESKKEKGSEEGGQASESGNSSWNRGLKDVNELNTNEFIDLKDNGVVKVNSSGSDRPLTSSTNSFYSTGNGEHIFVYDGNGKLIYDISNQRIKSLKINIDPTGGEHFQANKLKGSVPDAIKKLFGW